MSFFKIFENVLQIAKNAVVSLLSTLAVATEKVSTFLTCVTLSGQRPVALKELIISKYNDFKLFVSENVYRKINDKDASGVMYEQNEFLKFFVAKIKQMPLVRGIRKNVAQKVLAEMISIRHYLAVGKGNRPSFSYHIDTCDLDILDKSRKGIKKDI